MKAPDVDQKPLTGIKVLDLTQGIAGPYGTMLLGLHGADVVKIEPPEGDWSRVLGRAVGDESVNFLSVNRGKRSLCLNAKADGGREALLRLAAGCDIFVESFRPGVADKLGLGYEALRKLNPEVIYASVSGYGRSGPRASRPAVDVLIQAHSGMMVMNRTPEGQPYRMAMIVVDVVTGLYTHQAISAALIRKLRFGKGARLEVTLMQAAAAFQAAKIMEFAESEGKGRPLYAPSGCFPTRDGHIVITGMRASHFAALCTVLGRDDMIHDPRWPTQADRTNHSDIINGEMRKEFPKRCTREWMADLDRAGVLAEGVQDYGDWLRDEHVTVTRAFDWMETQGFGKLPVATVPGLLPTRDCVADTRPPIKGEHSRELLAEAGFSREWVDAQIGAGAVLQSP